MPTSTKPFSQTLDRCGEEEPLACLRRHLSGIIAVVFAKYGKEGISVISMRPASAKESKLFHDYLKES